jgi:hypothetical protein
MGKKRRENILARVRNADIRVVVPEETDEVNPVKSLIPGFRTEKTEIGVATISGEKALYLRLRLRGGD